MNKLGLKLLWIAIHRPPGQRLPRRVIELLEKRWVDGYTTDSDIRGVDSRRIVDRGQG